MTSGKTAVREHDPFFFMGSACGAVEAADAGRIDEYRAAVLVGLFLVPRPDPPSGYEAAYAKVLVSEIVGADPEVAAVLDDGCHQCGGVDRCADDCPREIDAADQGRGDA